MGVRSDMHTHMCWVGAMQHRMRMRCAGACNRCCGVWHLKQDMSVTCRVKMCRTETATHSRARCRSTADHRLGVARRRSQCRAPDAVHAGPCLARGGQPVKASGLQVGLHQPLNINPIHAGLCLARGRQPVKAGGLQVGLHVGLPAAADAQLASDHCQDEAHLVADLAHLCLSSLRWARASERRCRLCEPLRPTRIPALEFVQLSLPTRP